MNTWLLVQIIFFFLLLLLLTKIIGHFLSVEVHFGPLKTRKVKSWHGEYENIHGKSKFHMLLLNIMSHNSDFIPSFKNNLVLFFSACNLRGLAES